jgi:hypothetical protein
VVTEQDTRGEEQWLFIEKANRDGPVEHYVLTTLPKSMSRKPEGVYVRAGVRDLAHQARA